MAGELGAIVEGDGAAEWLGQSTEGGTDGCDDGLGVFGGQRAGDQGAAHALMQHEQVLAVARKGHEVGFPMAGDGAAFDFCRPLAQRHPVTHVQGRTAALLAASAALELAAGQVMAPAEVVVTPDLGVDEPVDGLGGDSVAGPSGHLLGRPAGPQLAKHLIAQHLVAVELAAAPAAGQCLLLSIDRLIADLGTAIALQLSSHRRWRAIQTCSDLPDRAPLGR